MIELTKNSAPVNLGKAEKITITCEWEAQGKDYDVFALVLREDGSVEHVAAFPATGVPVRMKSSDGSVTHTGDEKSDAVARHGVATEVIEVRPAPGLRSVVPVVYSAQGNKTGSFYRYRVSMEVRVGDKVFRVEAPDACRDDRVYSCVPARIDVINGTATLVPMERYSGRNSERRPSVALRNYGDVVAQHRPEPEQAGGLMSRMFGKKAPEVSAAPHDLGEQDAAGMVPVVTMDGGPRNAYK